MRPRSALTCILWPLHPAELNWVRLSLGREMSNTVEFIHRHAVLTVFVVYCAAAALFTYGVLTSPASTHFDWASKAAELLLLGAGLYSLLLIRNQMIAQERQLAANHAQLVDDHRWRTHITYHEHFAKVPADDIGAKMYELASVDLDCIDHFDDLGKPVSDVVCQRIVTDPKCWGIVRPYLDYFEGFCGAVNAGIVDEDYAFSLQATRIIRNFTVFEQLIKHYQKCNGTAYIELQKVATRWSIRASVARAARQEAIGIGAGSTAKLQGPQGVLHSIR